MSRISARARTAALAAMIALSAAASTAAAAATPGLRGVWNVGVTLVDCTSGTPLAPAFTSLLSFAGDNTESEATNNPALQPGQRSTGFGVWQKTGASTYKMTTYALILFASTMPHPISAGSQQITQAITLTGNTWHSIATIQFFDSTNTPTSHGCATAAAMRL